MALEQYPDVVMPECPAEKAFIGQAVAIALGKAGADVVVNYVSGEDQAGKVAAEIGNCGSRAYAHKADVSSEEQVRNMFQKMFKEFGTIDILINNAGLQKDAPFRIRVNSIAPGAIRTPINRQAWQTQQAYDALMELVP